MFAVAPLLIAAAHAADGQVTFEGAEEVVVAEIVDELSGVASGYGGTFGYNLVRTEDRCTAPCDLQVTPGFHSFLLYGRGVVPVRIKLEVRPDLRYVVTMDAKPAWMRSTGGLMTGLGVLGVVMGGTFAALDGVSDSSSYGWALPMAIGGAAATGGGVGLMVAGRSRVDVREAGALPPPTVGLQGAF